MTSKPCTPGTECQRHARRLGACVAGYCNPPAPGAVGRVSPPWAADPYQTDNGRQWRRDNLGSRVCIQCGAEVAYNQSEECPHA